MRASASVGCLVLVALAGCSFDEGPEPSISFRRPGTAEPLPAGSVLEVWLKPQGVYGTAVDLHLVGIAKDEVARFTVDVVSHGGETLAEQSYAPTSTAEDLGDGSSALTGVPVVFLPGVAATDVDGRPAALAARMDTAAPATGEVDVVLAIGD